MIELFRAELKRRWLLTRRYAGESIAGILGLAAVFYGLFLSAQYVAGPGLHFGSRLDAIVVGYVLWSLVVFILGDIAGGLQIEAQTGTLEQVFLSPFRGATIFIIRAIASLTLRLLLTIVMLLLIMALTGSRLSFSPTLLLPLLTIVLAAYGLALAFGSLALILKQVQQVQILIQFVLLFILALPTEGWSGPARWVAWMLPMSPGASELRAIMARGEGLDWGQWAIALVNGIVYFAIGLSLFNWSERQAKRTGKLSGY